MTASVMCPDVRSLERFVHGLDPVHNELVDHVERCEKCLATLKTLSVADTLVEAIQTAETIPDGPEQVAVRRLIAKVRTMLSVAPDPLAQTADVGPSAAEVLETSGSSLVVGRSEPDADCRDDGTHTETDEDKFAPAQAPDELGRLGGYRLLKLLGVGGMGKVFLAEDAQLRRKVALKVMKAGLARNPKARQRFVQEARLAAAIEHDNVVPIFQVGEDLGFPFLAMSFLNGVSLEDLLKQVGSLPLGQLLHLGAQIADGLEAAHHRGLIHRDIKPGNIWIEPTAGGRVKILDFGLARSTTDDVSLTQSGAILGTPAYMAPEQARGAKVDHRCDLYSLGCVLYRMATGDLPLKGSDTMGMLMALALNEPLPPIQLRPDLPPVLSELILKMLAKDCEKRPGSAANVARALREIAGLNRAPGDSEVLLAPIQEPLVVRPVARKPVDPFADLGAADAPALHRSKTKPLASWAPPRRRGMVLAVAGLAALLLLAGGVVFFIQTKEGVIRVESDDPELTFKLDEKGNYTLIGKEGTVADFSAGEHSLRFKKDDMTFDSDKFTLKKNDKIVVKVELHKGRIQIVQDDKVIDEKKIDPPTVARNPGKSSDPARPADNFVPRAPVAFRPFGHLDPAKIPVDERFPWQPKELVAVLGTHQARIWGYPRSLSVSSDGARVLCTGDTCQTHIFDAATLRPTGVFDTHDIWFSAFMPDGKTVVTTGRNGLWLWDLSGPVPRQKARLALGDEIGRGVVVPTRDGKNLITGENSYGINVWDLDGDKATKRLFMKGQNFVAATTDGALVATVEDWSKEKVVKVWDVAGTEPKERFALTAQHAPKWGSFSPDSKRLYLGNLVEGVAVWDLSGPKAVAKDTMKWPTNEGMSLSPDGKTIALSEITVALLDLEESAPAIRATFPTRDNVLSAFTPDSKKLVLAQRYGPLEVWDVSGAKPKRVASADGLEGELSTAVPSPDGKHLATTIHFDGPLRVWDMNGPAPLERAVLRNVGQVVNFSSDGKSLATVAASGKMIVRVWGLTEPEVRVRAETEIENMPMWARYHINFTPDGRAVAVTGYTDGQERYSVLVLDVVGPELKERCRLPLQPYFGEPPVFSADGKALIGTRKKENAKSPFELVTWDVTGPEPKELSVHQAPDGQWGHPALWGFRSDGALVLGGGFNGAATSWGWDVQGPKLKAWPLGGKLGERISFSDLTPDGKRAISTDGPQLTVWDLEREKEVWSCTLPGRVARVKFAPDGQHLITVNGNSTAYVLRLPFSPDAKPGGGLAPPQK